MCQLSDKSSADAANQVVAPDQQLREDAPMGGVLAWRRSCRYAAVLVLLTAPAAGQAAPYRFEDGALLGSAAFMPDWSATLDRQRAEAGEFHACLADAAACPRKYRGIRHVLERSRALEQDQQLKLINRYVNSRRYKEDRSAKLDTELSDEPVRYRSRWSTVGEFFARGGDCEDYATTKYFLLRELGFDADALRVVVTWDRRERGYHAILAVKRADGAVWLLDSDDRIRRRQHSGYRYIYAVNEHAVWDHEQPVALPLTAAEPTKETTL